MPEPKTDSDLLRFRKPFFLFAAVSVALFVTPVEVTQSLVWRWLPFLKRILPQVHWRLDGVGVFLAGTVIAVIATHYLMSWYVRERNRNNEETAVRWRLRSSIATVAICLMIFVVGISMAGVSHQFGWLMTSPEPYRIPAIQLTADSNISMYRPGILDKERRPNWITSILPYASVVRPQDDTSKAWNSPENAEGYRRVAGGMLLCPSQGSPIKSPDEFGLSHVAGNSRLFGLGSTRRSVDYEQFGQTILAGEVSAGFVPWGSPYNIRDPQLGLKRGWSGGKRGMIGYGSQHPGGANFCMLDGSIRFLASDIDSKILAELSRPKLRRRPEKR